MNHTCDGLSGQPTAIVVIPPRFAITPLRTQTPTLMVLQPPTPIIPLPPIVFIPQQAAPLVVLIAALIATLIVAPAAPAASAGTATPPSPPPAWYLHPSTARDRLNHTLNSLAIGPELVQPTATTPPGMQLPTPTAP